MYSAPQMGLCEPYDQPMGNVFVKQHGYNYGMETPQGLNGMGNVFVKQHGYNYGMETPQGLSGMHGFLDDLVQDIENNINNAVGRTVVNLKSEGVNFATRSLNDLVEQPDIKSALIQSGTYQRVQEGMNQLLMAGQQAGSFLDRNKQMFQWALILGGGLLAYMFIVRPILR
jgi:hypothetical protein